MRVGEAVGFRYLLVTYLGGVGLSNEKWSRLKA